MASKTAPAKAPRWTHFEKTVDGGSQELHRTRGAEDPKDPKHFVGRCRIQAQGQPTDQRGRWRRGTPWWRSPRRPARFRRCGWRAIPRPRACRRDGSMRSPATAKPLAPCSPPTPRAARLHPVHRRRRDRRADCAAGRYQEIVDGPRIEFLVIGAAGREKLTEARRRRGERRISPRPDRTVLASSACSCTRRSTMRLKGLPP